MIHETSIIGKEHSVKVSRVIYIILIRGVTKNCNIKESTREYSNSKLIKLVKAAQNRKGYSHSNPVVIHRRKEE